MDIFFQDPGDPPVPPDEVHIRKFEVSPWEDGRRVAVTVHVTPFQSRPNIEVSITNAAGREVATLSVVEAVESRWDFTMHLREAQPGGSYTARARLYYAELDEQESQGDDGSSAEEILEKAEQTVDTAEFTFEIAPS